MAPNFEMENQTEVKRKLLILNFKNHLVLTTANICIICVIFGCTLAYSSPAVENINSNRNPFHLTTEQQSWIGSAVPFGGLFGALIGGLLIDRFGRKLTIILIVPLYTISWVMITTCTKVMTLMIVRMCAGLFSAILLIAVTVYLSEIAPCTTRGMVTACNSFSMNVGYLLIYACGIVLSWRWLAILCAALLTVAMLFLPFLPETPQWLLTNGYKDASKQSLIWLRGQENVDSELNEIVQKLSEAKNSVGLRNILDKRVLKPLLLCMGLWIIQTFSGGDFLVFYTVTIFARSRNGMNSYMQTALVGLLSVIASLISIFTLDRFGRRKPLLFSTIISALAMTMMGFYYKIKEINGPFTDRHLLWLPLAALFLFQVSYCLGLGPVPYTLTAELLPMRARGIGSTLANVVLHLSAFIETKFALPLTESWIGTYGVFWIFAVILFLGTVFIYFGIPETKGKTLEAIEDMFA